MDCVRRAYLSENAERTLEDYWIVAHRHWTKYPKGGEGTAQEYGDSLQDLLRAADRSILSLASEEISASEGARQMTPVEAEEIVGYLSRAAQNAAGGPNSR